MDKDLLFEGSYLRINGAVIAIDQKTLEKIHNDEVEASGIRLNAMWLEKLGFDKVGTYYRKEFTESKKVEVFLFEENVIKIILTNVDDWRPFDIDQDSDKIHNLQFLIKHILHRDLKFV